MRGTVSARRENLVYIQFFDGGPRRSIPRTWTALINRLLKIIPSAESGKANQPIVA
jgi:hypothetical protein